MRRITVLFGLLLGLIVTPPMVPPSTASELPQSCGALNPSNALYPKESYYAQLACDRIKWGFEAAENLNGFRAKIMVERAEQALKKISSGDALERLNQQLQQLKKRTHEVRQAGYTAPPVQIAEEDRQN